MTIKDGLQRVPRRTRAGIGAALLLAMGAAGGAGAVSLTRPSVQMAPTVATPIARLAASDGIVTVKGRVAEVYGNRFVVQDGTGRAMVDTGRGSATVASGQPMMVQGRFADGQLRAAYLVGADGKVDAVGPAGGPPHANGPGGPGRGGPAFDGPPPPPPPPGAPRPGGPGAPPPPPPGQGCGPAERGALPPPPPAPAPAASDQAAVPSSPPVR